MISEIARRSIDEIFTRAVRGHLGRADGDTVDVEPLVHEDAASAASGSVVLLTISSFLFRLVTFFHVDAQGPLAAYFAGDDGRRRFDEAFGEAGNLCCGAMNRELGRHFDHLGMSTPYLLAGHCADYIDALRPDYVSRHRIAINGELRLQATLVLCAYAPLDFHAAPPAEEASLGAIEFF